MPQSGASGVLMRTCVIAQREPHSVLPLLFDLPQPPGRQLYRPIRITTPAAIARMLMIVPSP